MDEEGCQSFGAFGVELLICSICLDKFNQPKILPCLHSFCSSCLQQHFDTYKLRHEGRLPCPTCRELVKTDNGFSELRDDAVVDRTRDILEKICMVDEDADNDVLLDDAYGAVGGAETPEVYGAVGGAETLETSQFQSELRSTVRALQDNVAKLRSKYLKVYQIENDVQNAMDGAKQKNKKETKKETKQAIGRKESIALLATEEDRLYQSFVDIKSTLNILELFLSKGSPSLIQKNYTVLQRLLTEVTPFLNSETEMNHTITDVDLDRITEKCIPNQKKNKLNKRRMAEMLQLPTFKKAPKMRCKMIFKTGCRGITPGKFNFPVHVSFNPDGSFLVCDKNNLRIQLFSPDGKFLRSVLCGEVKPRRARVSAVDGLLYVSDEVAECVKVFTPEEKLVRRICKDFQCPAGMDINKQGNIIMTDAERCFVSVHKPSGEIITKFYHRFMQDKLIPNPYFAVFNDDNDLIVSDFRNNTVKVFTFTGKLEFVIEGLICPRGVCIDVFGNILIAEGDGHRVSMYDPCGKFLRDVVTAADGLQYPISVDISSSGQLIVSQCGYYSPHEILSFQVY